MVSVLYNNVQSAILNKVFLTQFWNPDWGVQQGCQLSCYLFILEAEILAIKIRNNTDTKGITLSEREIKIWQPACDTTLCISAPEFISQFLIALNTLDGTQD